MARAGADVLIAPMGLTTGGAIGATSGKTLDDRVPLIKEMLSTAVNLNPDIIALCHGGPIATPKDAQHVLSRVPGLAGFYGASSIEKLPVEKAIEGITSEFKQLTRAT